MHIFQPHVTGRHGLGHEIKIVGRVAGICALVEDVLPFLAIERSEHFVTDDRIGVGFHFKVGIRFADHEILGSRTFPLFECFLMNVPDVGVHVLTFHVGLREIRLYCLNQAWTSEVDFHPFIRSPAGGAPIRHDLFIHDVLGLARVGGRDLHRAIDC